MSDDRFPYLKNFLKPTTGVDAKSDRTPAADFLALLAPEGLVSRGKEISSGEEDTGGFLVEFHRREVPPKATPNTASQAPAPGERVLTCADCGFHEYQGPNPRQGWGSCTLKKRGCYGLRPACSEIPRDTWDG
jgi:hypothetical protein